MDLEAWFIENLVCPVDKHPLSAPQPEFVCSSGHRYPVLDGIPVMLPCDVPVTHGAARDTLTAARAGDRDFVDPVLKGGEVDPFVQDAVAATCGYMYKRLRGRLRDYPIPDFRFSRREIGMFLELGCNWGRWSMAAARTGYDVVGIDPSLHAIRAARRVARQLGLPARFVVGDARYLPFRADMFRIVFSYSVLQHFAKEDVLLALAETRRVLSRGGTSVIQMANIWGLRSLYHQLRRGFRKPRDFEVRYWALGELRDEFSRSVGPTEIEIDGFFSLNAQPTDAPMLPAHYRAVIWSSEVLRSLSVRLALLAHVADSLIVKAKKSG